MHSNRRAAELDLLRFLAALAVLLFHYLHLASPSTGIRVPAARYGYLGVDLFFMISGFVIMMSASQGKVVAFVASRAARLLPAFWTCCTATFLILAVAGDWRGWANYFANMSLVGLVTPIRVMDGSYWSLSYELRFYALVALVLAVGQIRRAEPLLGIWLLAAIALTAYPVRFVNSVVMQDYAAYFIAGATFYFVWSSGLTRWRVVMLAGCLALAEYHALQVAAALQGRDGVPFNSVVVLAAIAGFFLVLMAVAMRKTGALARGNWLAIGALTYPLYLLHQAIGMKLMQHGIQWVDRALLVWITGGLMIAAAWLVNTQVERRLAQPLRRRIQRSLAWTGRSTPHKVSQGVEPRGQELSGGSNAASTRWADRVKSVIR